MAVVRRVAETVVFVFIVFCAIVLCGYYRPRLQRFDPRRYLVEGVGGGGGALT